MSGDFFIGVPGEVRTRNLWRRRPILYPIELRVHNSYMVSEANFLLRLRLASVTRPLNSLSLSRPLIKWTSPVVEKQHFEVVFLPPLASP